MYGMKEVQYMNILPPLSHLKDPRSPRAFSSTPGERLSTEIHHGNQPDGATPLRRTGKLSNLI